MQDVVYYNAGFRFNNFGEFCLSVREPASGECSARCTRLCDSRRDAPHCLLLAAGVLAYLGDDKALTQIELPGTTIRLSGSFANLIYK